MKIYVFLVEIVSNAVNLMRLAWEILFVRLRLETVIVCEVETGNCVGCGLCVSVCLDDALVLIRRPEGELLPPPENIKTWGEVRFDR